MGFETDLVSTVNSLEKEKGRHEDTEDTVLSASFAFLLSPFCIFASGRFCSQERGAETENYMVSAIPKLI